ncbi:UDP-N-acetylmuramoyl-L-alanyl-D-glutamate--2,6-diaminopimelate ligase [Aliidiomarina halalkaliphila]|uniref:UDP-N-acetylmuramoyl-L-alanyl-D-glutamate--2,6-diaminopimelate ligase n=1 Tax=Aliidiomarina halalkaliphila TaxID=2593535 RepID=A0A552X5Y8_9GAMM|nr:UDP-N-acetylmuramoyl-L-alanyl-D-glutamate--2,6-diaminopimelate ligase [Aliidiomarina halalkaliphila]TRW50412.1 UDP-N-acetylmuramoyl-L-alanyl-D-glutamate--2,6-diaminopimelate ligase [Aliidiomarina halalkaliphila]
MIKLLDLIPDCPFPVPELVVSGLKLDSRRVAAGDAFIAVPGYATDGRDYIDAAVAAGASAVLADMDQWTSGEMDGVPVLGVPNLKQRVSEVAGRFHGNPSQQLRVIGVTGTNGKTTVSNLIAQLWHELEPAAAVLGTIGSGVLPQLLPEQNTTPDAVTVQQRLAGFYAEGARSVAMEVSSHALVQHRVDALRFATVIATNISRDHLDYHGSMDAYITAKKRLFSDFPGATRIFNRDDPVVAKWGTENDFWYSMDTDAIGSNNTLVADEIHYTDDGTEFTLCWFEHRLRVRSPLLGDFNVANVLAALLSPLSAGYSLADVAALVSYLKPVVGRMETFRADGFPLVVVDYAHTPDALEHVLTAARRHCQGKLWCVFGCGGDRDRGKRPQMGQVAARCADHVVVTDDNPRTEDPQSIIDDIISGMPANTAYEASPGRSRTVLETIRKAAPEDVVVLAGKGHETYQVIGNKSIDYDERAVVASVLGGAA